MTRLEAVTEKVHNGYYVDLFVRASNAVAINMYTKVGSFERHSLCDGAICRSFDDCCLAALTL